MLLTRRASTIVLWAAVWACVLFLVYQYVRKEYDLRTTAFRRPKQHVASLLDVSYFLERGADSSGRINLEAEDATQFTPPGITGSAWSSIQLPNYSQGEARYTVVPGAGLSWPAKIPPGRYEVEFLIFAYSKGTLNEAQLSIGDQSLTVAWKSRRTDSREILRKQLVIDQPADRVTFSATTIGQPSLLLDAISIVDVDRHDAAVRAKYVQYIEVVAAAGVLFFCGFCWGALVLRWLRVDLADPLAHLLISTALGCCLLGTVTTLLGTVHQFNRWTVIPALLAGALLGGRAAVKALKRWRKETLLWRKPLFTLATLPITIILGIALLAAFAPAAGVDPLIYHLAIPKWLILQGGYEYHPYQLPWGYPHLIPNLFAVGQLLVNDPFFRTAQLVHGLLGCLWIVSVYALGKAMFGRAAGLAAAMLCLSIEGVLFEAGLGLVDLGFAFISGATMLAFISAIAWEDRGGFYRRLILAALLAGGAAACKVNGPMVAVALAVAILVAAWARHGWRTAFASAILVALVSFSVALPMYAKNYLLYGNPLYPFPDGFANRDLCPEFVRNYCSAVTWDKYVLQFGKSALVTWPYLWTTKSFVDSCSPGPALLVGMLVFVASGREWLRRHWPIALFAAVLVPLWFFISPLTRFAWLWLIVPITFACGPLSERPLRLHRCLIPVLLIFAGLGVTLDELSRSVLMWNNLRGRETDTAYLQRTLPRDAGTAFAPPLVGIQHLNEATRAHPNSGRVLLDTNLTAYADFPTIPIPYYLMVDTFLGHKWGRIDGPVCLALCGKRVSDEEMLEELIGRLQVGMILQKKGMPAPPAPPDGRYIFSPDQKFMFTRDDLFDVFIERWIQRGWIAREEFADSILYTFTAQSIKALEKWKKAGQNEIHTPRGTSPSE